MRCHPSTFFNDPVFLTGAFTATTPSVARMPYRNDEAMELERSWERNLVLWADARAWRLSFVADPTSNQAFKEAMNYLANTRKARVTNYRFALEAKPNEPRAEYLFPTTGAYLAFIASLGSTRISWCEPRGSS